MSNAIKDLQRFVDTAVGDRGGLEVLEAGCGSASLVTFDPSARIVGIDISEQQLARNSYVDERILGDIQEYEFAPCSYDVIVCWNVLEHLPQPDDALVRFARALKDDGIVILGLPNVLSLKGLVTKYLPHTGHVYYYRHILGSPNAGTGDVGPFATPMRYSISAGGIRKLAARNGLSEAYFETWDGSSTGFLRSHPGARFIYLTLKAVTGFLSLGKLGDSEFIIVLRKPQPQPL